MMVGALHGVQGAGPRTGCLAAHKFREVNMNRIRSGDFFMAIVLVLASVAPVPAQEVRLRYLGHYVHQVAGSDHLVGVEGIGDHYALISSNLALALVDVDALPVGGTLDYLARLTHIDAYSSRTRPDGYGYVSIRQSGLAVVRVVVDPPELTALRQISEPDVYYEKTCVTDNRLYVTAHAHGLRIFDLTDPGNPALVGALYSGLDDAFAVAVSGQTAYVADGAGGLKIVDLADEANPVIVAGENPQSAPGTSEDVLIIGDHVYVAAGGAGVAVYPLGQITPRVIYDTPFSAEQLALLGEYLAVADNGGVEVFRIQPDGALTPAAHELAQRRSVGGQLMLRVWHGASTSGTDRVLAADWDTMDAYRLVDPATDDQPDLTASTQRIRFSPAGGTAVVHLTNDGSGPLTITNISSNQATFTVAPQQGALLPGESLDVTITYSGGQPGSGLVRITSNDPDESPLPIQVYGGTNYPDPGEPAVPFTLESCTYDHETQTFTYGTFNLADYAGKVVFFDILGEL
jgi:hypothetical protein